MSTSSPAPNDRTARRKAVEAIFRGDERELIAWLRSQHDSVLSDIFHGSWSSWQGNQHFDRATKPSKRVIALAKRVYSNRGEAASAIRVVLAKMYQHPDAATHSQWHIIPCRTSRGTIGVIDIAHGTAFDSGVECPAEAEDLGLVVEVYAAANSGAGTVSFDGEVVQRDGTAVTDGKVIPPTMPPGWQQIALPTWRGYEHGNGYKRVPAEIYEADPIRPTLAAYGLRTCYGRQDIPRRYLADYRKEKAASFNWLLADFERIDPSWWTIDDAEQRRLFECVDRWTQDAIEHLKQQLAEGTGESVKPLKFPGQAFRFPPSKASEQDKQEHALSDSRSKAASDAAKQVLGELGGFDIWAARGAYWPQTNAIGNRSLDSLQAILATTLYYRLVPVVDGLRWMVSFPDPERHYRLGPMQSHFEAALLAVAIPMARALFVGMRETREVRNEWVAIHLENGPRYFGGVHNE